MINIQMIMTALEKYNSYMFYAYSSDCLRSEDAKNFCEFIEAALQTLIFTDSENEKEFQQAQDINKILNEALTYAYRLIPILCRPRNNGQAKIVYSLISKISDITFIPDFYIKKEVKKCV